MDRITWVTWALYKCDFILGSRVPNIIVTGNWDSLQITGLPLEEISKSWEIKKVYVLCHRLKRSIIEQFRKTGTPQETGYIVLACFMDLMKIISLEMENWLTWWMTRDTDSKLVDMIINHNSMLYTNRANCLIISRWEKSYSSSYYKLIVIDWSPAKWRDWKSSMCAEKRKDTVNIILTFEPNLIPCCE